MMNKRIIITIIFSSLLVTMFAQKGDISISAGPLISFPLDKHVIPTYHTGPGLEAIGQYNISKKSALVLQASLASYNVTLYPEQNYRSKIFSFKGGYKYNFSGSGFYTNVLVGIDRETERYSNAFTSSSFTLGAGKRFTFKDVYFIEAGIDYIGGDTERRLNIKIVFSVFRWSKIEN